VAKNLFRQSDLERALRAAKAEGFQVVRCDFDGTKVSITFEKGGGETSVVETPLDKWLEKRRARTTQGG